MINLFTMNTLSDRIYAAMELRGMSQAELAAAVGVTRQTIISIENGRYTASLVLAYKLARFFGASIEEVFDFSDVEV